LHHCSEQAPVGHVPVGQEETWEPSLAAALNADNSFLGFVAPHFGHFGAGADAFCARCSKVFPHLSHLYS
jgi:hypothetical protein